MAAENKTGQQAGSSCCPHCHRAPSPSRLGSIDWLDVTDVFLHPPAAWLEPCLRLAIQAYPLWGCQSGACRLCTHNIAVASLSIFAWAASLADPKARLGCLGFQVHANVCMLWRLESLNQFFIGIEHRDIADRLIFADTQRYHNLRPWGPGPLGPA